MNVLCPGESPSRESFYCLISRVYFNSRSEVEDRRLELLTSCMPCNEHNEFDPIKTREIDLSDEALHQLLHQLSAKSKNRLLELLQLERQVGVKS